MNGTHGGHTWGYNATTPATGDNGGRSNNNNTDYNGNIDQSRIQGRRRSHNMDRRIKYFTGEESNAGAVLGPRSENMDLKESFYVFRENLANDVIRNFNNPGDVVAVVQDMEDPRSNFDYKHIAKDLTEYQEKSRV